MQSDRVMIANPFEDMERPSSRHHEVLREDLEPIHRRIHVENLRIVLRAQTDTETEAQEKERSPLRGGDKRYAICRSSASPFRPLSYIPRRTRRSILCPCTR